MNSVLNDDDRVDVDKNEIDELFDLLESIKNQIQKWAGSNEVVKFELAKADDLQSEIQESVNTIESMLIKRLFKHQSEWREDEQFEMFSDQTESKASAIEAKKTSFKSVFKKLSLKAKEENPAGEGILEKIEEDEEKPYEANRPAVRSKKPSTVKKAKYFLAHHVLKRKPKLKRSCSSDGKKAVFVDVFPSPDQPITSNFEIVEAIEKKASKEEEIPFIDEVGDVLEKGANPRKEKCEKFVDTFALHADAERYFNESNPVVAEITVLVKENEAGVDCKKCAKLQPKLLPEVKIGNAKEGADGKIVAGMAVSSGNIAEMKNPVPICVRTNESEKKTDAVELQWEPAMPLESVYIGNKTVSSKSIVIEYNRSECDSLVLQPVTGDSQYQTHPLGFEPVDCVSLELHTPNSTTSNDAVASFNDFANAASKLTCRPLTGNFCGGADFKPTVSGQFREKGKFEIDDVAEEDRHLLKSETCFQYQTDLPFM